MHCNTPETTTPTPPPLPCEVCEQELFHDGQTEGSAPDREHLALFHITPQKRREIGLYFRREIIVSLLFFFRHLCFYGHTGRFSQLSTLPSPFFPPLLLLHLRGVLIWWYFS